VKYAFETHGLVHFKHVLHLYALWLSYTWFNSLMLTAYAKHLHIDAYVLIEVKHITYLWFYGSIFRMLTSFSSHTVYGWLMVFYNSLSCIILSCGIYLMV